MINFQSNRKLILSIINTSSTKKVIPTYLKMISTSEFPKTLDLDSRNESTVLGKCSLKA